MIIYPKLSGNDFVLFRLSGLGLCNMLFPWARAVVAARNYNCKMISPIWWQIPLRKAHARRSYVGLFRKKENTIAGLARILLLLFSKKVMEEDVLNGKEGGLVVYKGLGRYFHDIIEDYGFVRNELLSITKDVHKKTDSIDFGNSISVHVRLGDFNKGNEDVLLNGGDNYRISLSWYISMIKKIREAIGKKTKVYIFSDAKDIELCEILSLHTTERINMGSPIADLLGLSNSKVLIASGSTYSMWASYLGRMPVIWHTGQMRQRLYYDRPHHEIELLEGDPLPSSFLENL